MIALSAGRPTLTANASRAVLDACVDAVWLAGGSVATLLAVNLLVFFLVSFSLSQTPELRPFDFPQFNHSLAHLRHVLRLRRVEAE